MAHLWPAEAKGNRLEHVSAYRVRVLAGVLAALPVGCALDGCDWSTSKPDGGTTDPAAESGPAGSSSDPQAATPAGPAADLPVLSDAALAARVAAQKRLLGRQSLFEDQAGKPVPALPTDDEPERSIDDDILDALPGSSGINVLDGQAETRANGNALGMYVPLENPKEPALGHFYDALRELERGRDPDGKVRIAVYGGSHTQADIYPEYMRSYLQERFGNGGAGFISAVRVNRWHRPFHFSIDSSKRWTVEHAQTRDGRGDGMFGLLGASGSVSRRREWTKISPRDPDDATAIGSRYEIYYLEQPGGGKFSVSVDGKKAATVDTEGEAMRAGYHALELEPGAHTIELKHVGGGEIRVFGATIENDDPGVVVDTLGISGTRASNVLKWDDAVWSDNIRHRDPDLFVLFFGTNEATDTDQPIERYRSQLEDVLARFRSAVPEASCLLMGPGDFPREVEEGVWVARPRLLQIREVQRDVAWEQGCAFWDGVAFMGGPGSMHTWATSRPQMASRDHIHFTRRGYVRVGMAVTDAIMAGYDDAE